MSSGGRALGREFSRCSIIARSFSTPLRGNFAADAKKRGTINKTDNNIIITIELINFSRNNYGTISFHWFECRPSLNKIDLFLTFYLIAGGGRGKRIRKQGNRFSMANCQLLNCKKAIINLKVI